MVTNSAKQAREGRNDRDSKTLRYDKPVSIVMIAYNEADHIKDVVQEYYHEILEQLPKGSEYIIYLDRPTDGTDRIVESLAKKLRLRIIVGKKNLGYALAMTLALKAAKNDLVFYSDSSGKHIAHDFWKLITYESRYDIITGWREPRTDPAIRQAISAMQQLVVSAMFLMPIHDFNTGYKIIHKNIIKDVLPDCKYMKQSFSSELLIRSFNKGYKIKSVPVTFIGRADKKRGTKYGELPAIIWKSLKGFMLLRIEMFKAGSKARSKAKSW